MRVSRLFGHTLRQPPADAELVSHQLLMRAAMIRPLAAGVYAYLPLGWRVIRRIERMFRQGMDALGGQEMCVPALHPADLWRASGRLERAGAIILRFRDRSGRDTVLAPGDEESLTDLLRRELHSHRQLPLLLYHIQTRFHDEPRPGDGLLRTREFLTGDAYSFHVDAADLDVLYVRICETCAHIFRHCGVEALAVEADPGLAAEGDAHAFVVLHERGDEMVLLCTGCDYAAHVSRATFQKGELPDKPLEESQEVATPGCKTIAAVADFVGVPEQRTIKAVFYADR
ncbi:MAG: aminoacyl--tRNA ligase-related protein, partial [Chloroflexota bacterium]|nr:aminoacyl--tRNA ligase-related protein [Chloroflexota bacterium]